MESYLSMIFFGGGEDKARKREAEGLPRPSEPNSRCRSSSEAWATWNVGICGVEGTERRRMKLPLSLVRSENGIRERTSELKIEILNSKGVRTPFFLIISLLQQQHQVIPKL